MLISPAFAQSATGASGGGAAAVVQFAPLIFIFVIFYFLLIRPQQQRAKEHRAMITGLKRGDTVVTGGGLIGKVARVDEDDVEVELAPNVRVRVVRTSIAEVRGRGEPVPANDAKR